MKTKLETLAIESHFATYGRMPNGNVRLTDSQTVMICDGLSVFYYAFSGEKIVDVWVD